MAAIRWVRRLAGEGRIWGFRTLHMTGWPLDETTPYDVPGSWSDPDSQRPV